MKRSTMWMFFGAFLVIQFIPVQRHNPDPTAPVKAPPLVMEVLERSCYDCHSNETDWPWYSHIAPVSFLIAHDVKEGREQLNFSEWNAMYQMEKARAAAEIWEEVEKNRMPLRKYVLLHDHADLSGADIKILMDWTASIERQKSSDP